MASIHNPTRHELFCAPLRRVVQPGETAECTDRQAAATGTSVFKVTRDTDPGKAPKTAPVATRTTSVRGSGVAEESGPPAGETR